MSRSAKRPEEIALFGDDLPVTPPAQRVNARLEAAALAEVLMTLHRHPLVAWIERQNPGVACIGGRFARFGWPGCSDILGQLKDGRLLSVVCKASKRKLQAEQAESLSLMRGFDSLCPARKPAVNSLQQKR
jgi:hypothetical protein